MAATALTIRADSREQLEQWRAAPFFVPVPTVNCWTHRDGPLDGRCEECWTNEEYPDPGWVKAGEPCPTCGPFPGSGRRGVVSGTDRYGRHLRWDPCPDCHGGKPRIAITVPCGKPLRDGWGDVWHNQCCGGTGRVTVGQAVIEHGPLPIVDIRGYDGETAIVIHYDGSAWLAGVGDLDRVWLPQSSDPALLVGTWGVICRTVEA